MNEPFGFDLTRAAAQLAIVTALAAIMIRLIPELLEAAWKVMPSALILLLIIWALRGMVRKLLD
jgi:hypothetical protein